MFVGGHLDPVLEPVLEDAKVLPGTPSKGGVLDDAMLGVQQSPDVEGGLGRGLVVALFLLN
jgi:hypothetical protein